MTEGVIDGIFSSPDLSKPNPVSKRDEKAVVPLPNPLSAIPNLPAGVPDPFSALPDSIPNVGSMLPAGVPNPLGSILPAGAPNPLGSALPAGVPNPFGPTLPVGVPNPLNQIPGSIPNLPANLPIPAGVLPSGITNLPGSLPIPIAAIPNPVTTIPSLPVQVPNPASVLPGTVGNTLPSNNFPQPLQPAGINPFAAVNPVASAIGGSLPVSVPGWAAAQAAPTTTAPRPSLPPGVVAPTAPAPGDVPPLLSEARPLAAEAEPTRTSAEHTHTFTGLHSSRSHVPTLATAAGEPSSATNAISDESDISTHSFKPSAVSSSIDMGEQTSVWASSISGGPTHTHSHAAQATPSSIVEEGHENQSTHMGAPATGRREDLFATSSVSASASAITHGVSSASLSLKTQSEISSAPTAMSSVEAPKATASSASEVSPALTIR